MSARRAMMQLLIKGTIGLGALFLVGVLLAAIPNHRQPVVASGMAEVGEPQDAGQQAQSGAMDHSKMAGMDMEDAKSSAEEATHDMANMHNAHSAHMHMTALRPKNEADTEQAKQITEQLRAGIEKYKDYHVALNEGYKIFFPNVPQPEYHFTNYGNGFLEALTFDPARPTSLLYKKTTDGYELVGAMYTMPKRATEEQLNERVPLSVAIWHLHTNLCMPPKEQRSKADMTKFGLKGSIATQEACDAAGGRFYPVIFGWMVHVYPYEGTTEKIFAMHHGD